MWIPVKMPTKTLKLKVLNTIIKYHVDGKDLDDLLLKGANTHFGDPNPLKCNLHPTVVRQLQ